MYYAERWRERETEGDREEGVCSVCIMQRDGERERQREIERKVCVVCVLCREIQIKTSPSVDIIHFVFH